MIALCERQGTGDRLDGHGLEPRLGEHLGGGRQDRPVNRRVPGPARRPGVAMSGPARRSQMGQAGRSASQLVTSLPIETVRVAPDGP
jgi:hypothetical protein